MKYNYDKKCELNSILTDESTLCFITGVLVYVTRDAVYYLKTGTCSDQGKSIDFSRNTLNANWDFMLVGMAVHCVHTPV